MRSLVRLLCCAALLSAAMLGTPRTAGAQGAQAQHPQYETAITTVYGSKYPITGRLDLDLFPDGTLRGYYHTSYEKLFIPVVGGRDGDYIWFDIGPSSIDLGLDAGPQGKLHVVATMNPDGSFRGQVFPETAATLNGSYPPASFTNPAPTPSDQYIFNAKAATNVEATPAP